MIDTVDRGLRRDGLPRQSPGRKPKRGQLAPPHRARFEHAGWLPVHVTLRAAPDLPSFRDKAHYPAFEKALRDTRRDDFRIVAYAIEPGTVHLIVEADDNGALARGMSSFAVRANRLFNASTGVGRGRVWAGRYWQRELATARDVRAALAHFPGVKIGAHPAEEPGTFLMRAARDEG